MVCQQRAQRPTQAGDEAAQCLGTGGEEQCSEHEIARGLRGPAARGMQGEERTEGVEGY